MVALTKQVAERSAKLRRTQDESGLIDSPRGESILVTWSPKIYHEARCGAPIRKIGHRWPVSHKKCGWISEFMQLIAKNYSEFIKNQRHFSN